MDSLLKVMGMYQDYIEGTNIGVYFLDEKAGHHWDFELPYPFWEEFEDDWTDEEE